jgi:acetyl-CoA synthetase
MNWPPLTKTLHDWKVPPNLADYSAACAGFSWPEAAEDLDGLPDGKGLNIAHEAVDRHAVGPRAQHIAWRWLGKSGEVREFTYAELREAANRFANVLAGLSVSKGDRVYVLAGRVPELYTAALGTLKHRSSVLCFPRLGRSRFACEWRRGRHECW